MIFGLPWAWLGLLSVPVLVALYVLRRKSRRRTVSSLLLWRSETSHREGGRRLERFEAPPLFWLELSILLLLVSAAAAPLLPTPDSRRPLIVVLDDSFSMRAGGADSALRSARSELLAELRSSRHRAVTLILAGARPRRLGEGGLEIEQVAPALAGWRASAGEADLGAALRLAFKLGGRMSRLLVLSDRPPSQSVLEPRLAWWAFGRPRANLAFVQAVRSRREEEDGSCLFEVANFSNEPATAELRVRIGENSPKVRSLRFAAEAKSRVRLAAPAGAKVIAELEPDALDVDNTAILLPEHIRSVRVQNRVRDPALAELVEKTLRATGRARLVDEGAELMVSEEGSSAGAGVWAVRFRSGGRAVPYVGPFVLDRDHPLSEGLELEGVVWAASEAASGGGGAVTSASRFATAVISAGDVPLVLDREELAGRHEITLFLDPRLSTLTSTPNWPILWWNLLAWRAASAPGLSSANFRLGETVTLSVEPRVDAVLYRPPQGGERSLPVVDARAELATEEPGVHELISPEGSERFAVNALAASESDLRGVASGRWGDWQRDGETLWSYRPLGWLLLLAALALFLGHLRWTAGRASGRRPA